MAKWFKRLQQILTAYWRDAWQKVLRQYRQGELVRDIPSNTALVDLHGQLQAQQHNLTQLAAALNQHHQQVTASIKLALAATEQHKAEQLTYQLLQIERTQARIQQQLLELEVELSESAKALQASQLSPQSNHSIQQLELLVQEQQMRQRLSKISKENQ